MQLWDNILDSIEKKVSPQNFDIWFRPTSQHAENQEKRELIVRVPNQHFKYWLSENYSEVIHDSLDELDLSFNVSFLVGEEQMSGQSTRTSGDELCRPCDDPDVNLNAKYTFGTFVVGGCNEFAHAAALAVGDQPSLAYNPFFLYGGVGLGKTHLMHAIGHYAKTKNRDLRLVYMSSECFMNELIHSIRYDRMIQFREKYRNIDVLLMDDIQFLAGKERTQEEFFHTFNALYDAQKQIIISSDSRPRDIPTLEERLHSRFEWGLIADLQPPELETKIAILRKKAECHQVDLKDDVVMFIAGNIKSNIRELEGALIRLIAYSSLTGEPINLSLAERVLSNLAEARTRVISLSTIQQVVAKHYGLKVSELKARNNGRRVSEPRQVAMYLCKELTGVSLSDIGREFGGKHHTTVLHAVRKVKRLHKEDFQMRHTTDKLKEAIQRA